MTDWGETEEPRGEGSRGNASAGSTWYWLTVWKVAAGRDGFFFFFRETASDVEQSGTWEDQGQSQGRGGHQSLGIRVMGVQDTGQVMPQGEQDWQGAPVKQILVSGER